MDHYLIVGADQGIGMALFDAISAKGFPVSHTTRRECADGIFLNLADPPKHLNIGAGVSCVFICAAVSNFTDCERKPECARQVNVEGSLVVARSLLEKNCFVIFLSSSAVFDGSTPWPNEATKYTPTTEYGRQKTLTEKRLLELDEGMGRVAIVRLTKVLTGETPVVKRFISGIREGVAFDACSDLNISPISMPYVVKGLLKIASKKIGGVFHLSGEDELSYADFARRLALGIKNNAEMVRDTDSSRLDILFKPEFPGLGMERTRTLIGLNPDSGYEVIKNILSKNSIQKL